MEVEKMEVEGVTYSLLLRVQNGHIPSPELSLYKQTLSNAAKSKGQRYLWIQVSNILEFWVALEKDNA